MQVRELGNFPPDDNPFWHDAVSVGLRLGDFLAASGNDEKLKEYFIMSSGNLKYDDFYIVHQPTGKRIGVKA